MLDASAAVYGLASAEEFAGQQLVERLLEPSEPAALIAWLCGAGSGGVTGAALPVDGGMTTS
jgi:NAD(P)-dependent dehydrogenase (short-subunit alcohol dehydrogenase family)